MQLMHDIHPDRNKDSKSPGSTYESSVSDGVKPIEKTRPLNGQAEPQGWLARAMQKPAKVAGRLLTVETLILAVIILPVGAYAAFTITKSVATNTSLSSLPAQKVIIIPSGS